MLEKDSVTSVILEEPGVDLKRVREHIRDNRKAIVKRNARARAGLLDKLNIGVLKIRLLIDVVEVL